MSEATLTVKTHTLRQLAEALTGYGHIEGIDHEGTITYRITTSEGDDFTLGQMAEEVKSLLRTIDTDVDVERKKARA